MKENFKPMFEGGVADPKVIIPKFGKRGVEMGKLEIVRDVEKEFKAFIESEVSSGDKDLDEMRSDYIALEAFNDVAGVFSDSNEMERIKENILAHLKGK